MPYIQKEEPHVAGLAQEKYPQKAHQEEFLDAQPVQHIVELVQKHFQLDTGVKLVYRLENLVTVWQQYFRHFDGFVWDW